MSTVSISWADEMDEYEALLRKSNSPLSKVTGTVIENKDNTTNQIMFAEEKQESPLIFPKESENKVIIPTPIQPREDEIIQINQNTQNINNIQPIEESCNFCTICNRTSTHKTEEHLCTFCGIKGKHAASLHCKKCGIIGHSIRDHSCYHKECKFFGAHTHPCKYCLGHHTTNNHICEYNWCNQKGHSYVIHNIENKK